MINVIRQSLLNQARSFIYYLVGLVLYMWMLVAIYPQLQTINLDQYIQQMPKQLIQFFGGSEGIQISTLQGFLSMEFLSFIFILVMSFFVVNLAGTSLAGMVERRTADLVLSQPIARWKIVLGEAVSGVILSTLLVWGMTGSMWAASHLSHIPLSGHGLLAFGVTATLFVWVWLALALAVSATVSSRGTVTAFTFSLVLASYIFTSLAKMFERLAPYAKWSLFHLYEPQNLLNTGVVDHHALFIFGGLAAVLLGLACLVWQRRDI